MIWTCVRYTRLLRDHPDVGLNGWAVGNVIATHSDNTTGECRLSLDTLVRESRLPLDAVNRGIDELSSLGLLTADRVGVYRAVVDQLDQSNNDPRTGSRGRRRSQALPDEEPWNEKWTQEDIDTFIDEVFFDLPGDVSPSGLVAYTFGFDRASDEPWTLEEAYLLSEAAYDIWEQREHPKQQLTA